MKRFILPAILVFLFILVTGGFSIIKAQQSERSVTMMNVDGEDIKIWGDDDQACTAIRSKNAGCQAIADKCVKDGGCAPQLATLNFMGCEKCDAAAKPCFDSVEADYKQCIKAAAAKYKEENAAPSKAPEQPPYTIDIKSFLDRLEKTQTAIDQCTSPRIPSENDCVAARLPILDIPLYIKDAGWDPKYADGVILDDPQAAQVVSFSKDTAVPNSVNVNKYGDPSNFTFEPELLIAKKTARSQFILGTQEAGTSGATYGYTLAEGSGEYSVFNMPGKVWASGKNLVVLDKDPRLDSVKVGGPAVENITRMVLASDAKVTLADFPNKSVMEVSNKARIVVAGMAADDTLEAAQDLIITLKRWDE